MILHWLARVFRRKQRILLVMRLDDMFVVHPSQIIAACSSCGAEVGVYPSGQRVLRRYRHAAIICSRCRMLGQDEAQLAPGAIDEVGQSVPR
jgi:hypothetical protein